MKKILTVVVVLTVVFSSVVNANEIDKPKSPVGMAVVNTGSVVKLFYQGVKSGRVKVTIINANNETIFKETLSDVENFMRPYNFSSLPDGAYRIVLEGENGKQVQTIAYKKPSKLKLMDLTQVAGVAGKYMLRVSNKEKDVLTVRIFDRSASLVYEATENISHDFAKLYNLEKVGEGFYIEVTGKNGITQTLTAE
jgi:hypothetical protein